MKHFRRWVVLAGLIIATAMTTGIDISDSRLVAVVTVTNLTGDDQGVRPQVVALPLSTQDLADGGLIDAANWLNIEIHDAAGNDVPFMPAWERSNDTTRCFIDDGGVYSHDTADCNDVGVGDFFLLPGVPAVDDAFGILAQQEFRKLWFDISTPGTMSGDIYTVVWEYCIAAGSCPAGAGSFWLPLDNVQDNTEAFTKPGLNSVSWDIPTDQEMRNTTVDGVEGFAVRARLTDIGTLVYGRPIGSTAHYEAALWFVLADSLGPGDSEDFFLYAGTGSNTRTSHRFFPGSAGFTSPDDPDLELGSDFEVEIKGTFATDVGSASMQPIIQKDSASTFLIEAGNNVIRTSANGVTLTSGSFSDNVEHTILVDNDAADGFRLFIDGSEVASGAQQTVPNTADVWEFPDGFVDPAAGATFYYEFIKITVSGTLQVHYETNVAVQADAEIQNRVGDEDGVFPQGRFPGIQNGILDKEFLGVVSPLQSLADIDASLGAAAHSDVVDDVSGTAEGTAFAGLSAPSSSLPGFTFLNSLATKDYDPTQGGTQGIPIAFFYIVIAGAILIMAMTGVMIASKSLLYAVIAGGVVAALFVSVTVISPWFLMWFAIPAVLLFLVKGPISL